MTRQKITLEELQEALKNSWSIETSSDPQVWTPENPAWGQCAVTARIVQDYFGGNLLRAFFDIIHNGKALNVSHYWNQLPDGSEIDLTKEQFPKNTIIPAGTIKERNYVLSWPDTVIRYDILKQRVEKYLEKQGEKMNELKGFDPIEKAEAIRPKMIDLVNKKVLLARFANLSQGNDIFDKHRVNDFFRKKQYQWPDGIQKESPVFRGEPAGIASLRLNQSLQKHRSDKTPIALLDPADCNSVVLFQIAGCNVNCWQCYVDDISKSANPEHGRFFSAEEILMEFLVESRKTSFIIDPNKHINILRISGGEPFLVPELIVWMIEAVQKFNLEDLIYLWVDTNLMTGDFYWKYLDEKQREKIRNFRNIGFMGCYKGYDEESFTKTCGAAPEFFQEQFKTHRRLIEELDVYTYLYPLTYSEENLKEKIVNFIYRLRTQVNIYAPLRLTTPYVKTYSPTETRLNPERKKALELQYKAIEIWKQEMQRLFPGMIHLLPHEVWVI